MFHASAMNYDKIVFNKKIKIIIIAMCQQKLSKQALRNQLVYFDQTKLARIKTEYPYSPKQHTGHVSRPILNEILH